MSTKPNDPGTPRGVTWKTAKGGPAVSVARHLNRQALAVTPVALALPAETRARIEQMHEAGGINGAMVGLLTFALDELERRQLRLLVDLGG